ncbi:hypothetical protein EHQ53_00285 [Leptospira langatensis]|uniref:Uncharacterized protein n=1 Tax=Leptospira langatensis TaxID=2484983 RepID=A0A5F1ZYJ6_9LEPT|nr:hypothetical protein [Leptospira langatensis]TGJ98209.1 hypothetical protein EHO57_16430 [Leptospira langatensis]TGL43123.1 hypothetical protein EHQ53_00285 [Leptospira langatensis]
MQKILRTAFLSIFLLIQNQCIMTYRDFPEPSPPSETVVADQKNPIHFKITRFTGWSESKVVLYLEGKGWKEVTGYPPEKGIYIEIQSVKKSPSTLAAFLIYISYATFGILPSFSGKDGAQISMIVYKDSKRVTGFEYEFTRKTFIWLAALPFVWLNFMTNSDFDAYKGILDKFSSDLKITKL